MAPHLELVMSSGGLSAEERNRFPEMLQRGSRSDMVDFMGRDDFTMENLSFNGDYGAACNAGDGPPPGELRGGLYSDLAPWRFK